MREESEQMKDEKVKDFSYLISHLSSLIGFSSSLFSPYLT